MYRFHSNLGSHCHEAFVRVLCGSYQGGSSKYVKFVPVRGVTLCTWYIWRSWCRHVIRPRTKKHYSRHTALRIPNHKMAGAPFHCSRLDWWVIFNVTLWMRTIRRLVDAVKSSCHKARSRGGSVFIELRLTRSFDVKKVRLTAINLKND